MSKREALKLSLQTCKRVLGLTAFAVALSTAYHLSVLGLLVQLAIPIPGKPESTSDRSVIVGKEILLLYSCTVCGGRIAALLPLVKWMGGIHL